MPFDFPNSPTVGQSVTASNGVTYVWDGVKWVTGSAAAAVTPTNEINALTYSCIPDLVAVNGPFTWSGTTFSAPNANFKSSDVGKTLIVPFGGGATGSDAPVIAKIVGWTDSHTLTVDTTVVNPFSNAQFELQRTGALAVTLNTSAATGGAIAGEVLTMVGGTYARPGTFYTVTVTAKSVAIVNAGSGGPPNATMYLRGTTGHGRRVLVQCATNASGALTGTPTLVQQGCYYINPTDPANEPLDASQFGLTLPATWQAGTASGNDPTKVKISKSAVHANVMTLIRVGQFTTNLGTPTTITAIDTSSDPQNFILTVNPAVQSSGTNSDVVFTNNRGNTTFQASYASGSTTLTVVGTLPSSVLVGQLISGLGIVGAADPTQDPSTQTTITNIAGSTITISQPTTAGTSGAAASVTTNPFLSGAVVSVALVQANITQLDGGIYNALPAFPAHLKNASGADVGTVVTPATDTITLSYGTDNGTGFADWATAVRNAAAAATAATPPLLGAAIEAVIPPGNYLTTQSINLIGLAASGLAFRFTGTNLQCAAADRTTDATYGFKTVPRPNRVVLDMRAGRFWVADSPMVTGDYCFPPLVGLACGRVDARQGSNMLFTNVTARGYFNLAGVSFQGSESTHVRTLYATNYASPGGASPPFTTPPLAANQRFGVLIDGQNHWPIPNEAGVTGVLPQDSVISFNDLRITSSTSTTPGGGIPWTSNRTSGLRMLNCYSATGGPPHMLWFSDTQNEAVVELHCELRTDTSRWFGAQDAIYLANFNGPLAFNATYKEYSSWVSNSIFAYDVEGFFGRAATGFSTQWMEVDLGFSLVDVQLFDRIPSSFVQMQFGGDIVLHGQQYLAECHYIVRPPGSPPYGRVTLGDTRGSGNTQGTVVADNLTSRNALTAVDGNFSDLVTATNGLQVGTAGLPYYGHWDQTGLYLGRFGSTGSPSTLLPQLAFAAQNNTNLSGTTHTDHRFVAYNPGTLDLEGYESGNKAYLRVQGVLQSDAQAYPATLTPMSALTSGGTVTLTMVNSAGTIIAPGPMVLNTGGSTIASATLALPDNATPPPGYEQSIDCNGTITAFTVVSQAGVAIINPPTALAKGGVATFRYHDEATPPYWAAWTGGVGTVPVASTITPVMNGVASAGTLAAWSAGDHVHPTDTTRFAVAGGTITGVVTIGGTNASISQLSISAAAGQYRVLELESSGTTRWHVRANSVTETGTSNVGSDFEIARYSDAGTYLSTPFSINRSTAVTNIGSLTVTGVIQSNGSLTVGSDTAAAQFIMNGPAGAANRLLQFNTASVARWRMSLVNTETGTADAGGDLQLSCYHDAGTQIAVPITITRSSGVVTIGTPGLVAPAAAGITVGAAGSGPTIRSGAGAPSGTQPAGSLWIRNNGTVGAQLYVSAGGGTWNAVAGV